MAPWEKGPVPKRVNVIPLRAIFFIVALWTTKFGRNIVKADETIEVFAVAF